MSGTPPIPWKFINATLSRYAPFWAGCTLLCGAIGFGYSVVKDDTWEASQPLLIREEANGSVDRLGRFSSQTELVAAQETILEMARNYDVVEKALKQLDPPSSIAPENWPSSKVVETVAASWINVRAPETSEFGKTEVIYLVTKAESPARAELFCRVLFNSLSRHLREVRIVRSESIVLELKAACMIAQNNLAEATKLLSDLETSVGMDLGELRGLSESISGENGASRIRGELDRENMVVETEAKKAEALLQLLKRSYDSPELLLVSDGELLASQPTLQRLKSGLIDAQLEASKLSGRLTDNHPMMLAAKIGQDTIRTQLRAEIANVIQTMKPALEVIQQKRQRLADKQQDVETKLVTLAKIRADYSQLLASVESRSQLLSEAQASLAEAESSRSAALNTNLLAALGPPRASENPVGMGTSMVTAAALAAGLMLGLGGVFLIAPSPSGQHFSRRFTDTLAGRRTADRNAASATATVSTSVALPQATSDRRSVNRLSGSPNQVAGAARPSVEVTAIQRALPAGPSLSNVQPAQTLPTKSSDSASPRPVALEEGNPQNHVETKAYSSANLLAEHSQSSSVTSSKIKYQAKPKSQATSKDVPISASAKETEVDDFDMQKTPIWNELEQGGKPSSPIIPSSDDAPSGH